MGVRDSLDIEAVEKSFDKTRGTRAARPINVSLALSDIHGIEPKSFKRFDGAAVTHGMLDQIKQKEKEKSKTSKAGKGKKSHKSANGKKPVGNKQNLKSRNRSANESNHEIQQSKTSKIEQKRRPKSNNRKKPASNHESKRKSNQMKQKKNIPDISFASSNFPSAPPPRSLVSSHMPGEVSAELSSLQAAANGNVRRLSGVYEMITTDLQPPPRPVSIKKLQSGNVKRLGNNIEKSAQSSPTSIAVKNVRNHPLVKKNIEQSTHSSTRPVSAQLSSLQGAANGNVRRFSQTYAQTPIGLQSSPRLDSVEVPNGVLEDKMKNYMNMATAPQPSAPPLSAKRAPSGTFTKKVQHIESSLASKDSVLLPTPESQTESIYVPKSTILDPSEGYKQKLQEDAFESSTSTGGASTSSMSISEVI